MIPSGIRVLGDYVRVQGFLPLEPVGLDTDGKIKDVHELSYEPASAWEGTVEGFERITDEKERRLAQDSVFRWYRVKETFDTPLKIDVDADGLTHTLKGKDDVFNLSATLYVDENGQAPADNYGGRLEPEATVHGYYWPRNHLETLDIHPDNGDTNFRLPFSFTLDTENKIVKFPFQVFRIEPPSNSEVRGFAELWLYASYTIRVPSPSFDVQKAMAVFSYFLPLNTNNQRVSPAVVRERKLRYWVWQTTDHRTTSYGYVSNLTSENLLSQAERIAAEAAVKYNDTPASEAIYNSIIPIRLDGAIQSVTWSFGLDGAFTRVSRNTEPDYILSKHRERVLVSEIRKKVDEP